MTFVLDEFDQCYFCGVKNDNKGDLELFGMKRVMILVCKKCGKAKVDELLRKEK